MAIVLAWIGWDDAEPDSQTWSALLVRARARSPHPGIERAGQGWRVYAAATSPAEPPVILCSPDRSATLVLLDRAAAKHEGPLDHHFDAYAHDGSGCAALRIELAPLRVTLYRDILGQRVLVYAKLAHGLLIASSEQILLAHPQVDADLDEDFLAAYFIALPPAHDATAFKGIHAVAAGETLQFTAQQTSSHRRRLSPTDSWCGLGDGQIAERMGDLLEKSVRRACSGAKRIGISLSAGLDSSAIAAALMAVKSSEQTAIAVTYAFPQWPEINEGPLVAQCTKFLQLEHRAFDADDLDPLAPNLVRAVNPDTPLASIYREIKDAAYAQFAAAHVEVWLDGSFSDHLFSNNADWLLQGTRAGRWRELQNETRWRLNAGAWRSPWRDSGVRKLGRRMLGLADADSQRLLQLRPDLANRLRERWRAELAEYRDFPRPQQTMTCLNGYAMAASCGEHFYAQQYGIRHHSPFRDLELTRWMLSIPGDLHERLGVRKWLLRNWLSSRVPAAISQRPKGSDLTPFLKAAVDRQREHWQSAITAAAPIAQSMLTAAAFERGNSGADLLSYWLLASFGLWRSNRT